MLKKSITYTDFNGDEVTEDFYFHLTKAELVEIELSHKDGMEASIKRIVASENGAELIKEFKNLIFLSYGQRSPDGRRFIKNQELREEFESSEAYSVLFMELMSDTDQAIAFFNGIVPEGMSVGEAELANIDPDKTPIIAVDDEKIRTYSRAQLQAMEPDEYNRVREDLEIGRAKIAD